jgi:hypothetical protein
MVLRAQAALIVLADEGQIAFTCRGIGRASLQPGRRQQRQSYSVGSPSGSCVSEAFRHAALLQNLDHLLVHGADSRAAAPKHIASHTNMATL